MDLLNSTGTSFKKNSNIFKILKEYANTIGMDINSLHPYVKAFSDTDDEDMGEAWASSANKYLYFGNLIGSIEMKTADYNSAIIYLGATNIKTVTGQLSASGYTGPKFMPFQINSLVCTRVRHVVQTDYRSFLTFQGFRAQLL